MSEIEDLLNALRASMADAKAPEFPTGFYRALIEDPGGPGQVGLFGEVLAPPGWREETDEELRTRIKKTLGMTTTGASDE